MPIGEYGAGLRRKSCERFQNLFRRRLQRVDPQIGWCPPRHRLTFGNGAVAELAGERRPEPLRNIGAGGIRSIIERSRQPSALDVRERRRRVIGSVTGLNNLFRRETEGGGCGTDRKRPRRIGAQRPGQRGASPERVVDEPTNGITIAGTRKAMSFAPVGQRNGDGLIAVENCLQNLDRRRDPSTWPHVTIISSAGHDLGGEDHPHE